jgi:hypothetical protein
MVIVHLGTTWTEPLRMAANFVLIYQKNREAQNHSAYPVDKLKIIPVLVDFSVDKSVVFAYTTSVLEGRGNVCPDLIEND